MGTYSPQGWSRRRFLGAAGVAGAGFMVPGLTGGCFTTNPATGRSAFTGFMSESQEIQIGREYHPKLLEEFGGEYKDAALSRYVTNIGRALAARSENPNLSYTFTVLDTDMINAFAVPGGYVYTTRGLLALCEDEAELAGVIGHELGHINSRHAAERYSDQQLMGLGVGLVAILTGSQEAAQLGQIGAALALQSWSRQQEFEADLLGVRYIAKNNYDPKGMADFLHKLRQDTKLEALMAGKDPNAVDQSHYLSTHPRTIDRVQAALKQAGSYNTQGQGRTGREDFLDAVDGMLYGSNPKEGVIRGQTFAHPGLRITFTVPEDFKLVNGSDKVQAIHRDGAGIIFDIDGFKGQDIAAYLANGWARDARLREVQRLNINGMKGATGITQGKSRSGTVDVRLVAAKDPNSNAVYRFMFATPRNLTRALESDLQRTTYSLRPLSAREARQIRPLRLDVVTVRRGDTPQSLASRMPYSDFQLERWEVLNGRSRNKPLRAGERVKIVVS